VRLTVEARGAWHWPEWSRQQGISEAWYEALANSGGDPEHWWVSPQPIEERDWLDIQIGGKSFWTPKTGHPARAILGAKTAAGGVQVERPTPLDYGGKFYGQSVRLYLTEPGAGESQESHFGGEFTTFNSRTKQRNPITDPDTVAGRTAR